MELYLPILLEVEIPGLGLEVYHHSRVINLNIVMHEYSPLIGLSLSLSL